MAIQYPIPQGLNETWTGAQNWLTRLFGNTFDPNQQTQPPAMSGIQAPPQSLPELMAGMIMQGGPKEAYESGMIGMGPMPTDILYHGTSAPFNKFNLTRLGKGAGTMGVPGVYFTSDKNLAKTFAKVQQVGVPYKPRIIHSDIDTSKLYEMDITELIAFGDGGIVNKFTDDKGKKLSNSLIKQGYEGIKIKPATSKIDSDFGLQGEFNNPQYIIFNPSKINVNKVEELKYTPKEIKKIDPIEQQWNDALKIGKIIAQHDFDTQRRIAIGIMHEDRIDDQIKNIMENIKNKKVFNETDAVKAIEYLKGLK
jgi:hypothetical protein